MASPPSPAASGASGASVRQPAVAGTFYPADPGRCRAAAAALVRVAPDAGGASRRGSRRPWRGAIVPHAGWVCSGAIAGEAIATLAAGRGEPPDVVVVFGAIHTPLHTTSAALSSHRAWHEPTGDSEVEAELGAKLTEAGGEGGGLFAVDDRFHRREHAVEVELPLIQAAWPGARVLPVEVPVTQDAAGIGRRAARQAEAAGLNAVFLASSDLTHYGPSYGFAPAGVGPQGLAWAKDNDRRLLDLVTAMRIERVVPEVRENLNACGGGAIAAMLAACRELGADESKLLRHQSSFETLADVHPQPPVDAVGYAGVVVG
jgi:AmmeMemoRadiSam system protein B